LNPLVPPGTNFDLSAWKLQTLTTGLAFTEVAAAQLVAGHTSIFFYTDSIDGSMVMRVPSNGGTTSGSTYPRVELRQTGNGTNWRLADPKEHYLSATCRVMTVASSKPQVIIGQIHGSDTESELLKLRWTGYQAGKCIVEARYQRNDTSRTEYGVTIASGLSLGDIVSYVITMNNGLITVTINSVSASQTYTTDIYGTTDAYYFKAGDYLNYNGTNPVVNGQVQFYALTLNRPSTAIENESGSDQGSLPKIASLSQNFPNPFNPSTTLSFELSVLSPVDLRVFDLLGREVAILMNEEKPPGEYAATWNAANMPSGLYFCTLQAGGFRETIRMVLSK
jgi:hypothetical protein